MSESNPASSLQLAKERFYQGVSLLNAGKHAEAIDAFRGALELDSRGAATWANLSFALRMQGQFAEAVDAARRATELAPKLAAGHEHLAAALIATGKPADALDSAQKAVSLDPNNVYAWTNLGEALHVVGRNEESAAILSRAVEVNAALGDAWALLAQALRATGRIADSLAANRRATTLLPESADAPSALLYKLNFSTEHTPREIFDEHRSWGRKFTDAHATSAPPLENDRSPDRRLRIGYISPDFCDHAVARFFQPLLAAHDRDVVEVFCYCNGRRHDAVTDELRSQADGWREIDQLDDDAAVRVVRDDRIDLLIDLAGHTDGNRLLLMAYRPAPVQCSYLGYPNTTGMTAIDYRITDAISDPPGEADALHTERLARLPRTAWCYRPPADAGDVVQRASDGAVVTFGSFNNVAKMNERMLDLWERILQSTPASRLMLKNWDFRDHLLRERFAAALRARGLPNDRFVLLAPTPTHSEHYAAYAEIDIALDTTPYNGTTTTCDALWMGVPVITLQGDRHAARVGASLLNAMGLDDLVASSPDACIAKAVSLAEDARRRVELRRSLRRRMQDSPLMNGVSLARAIEALYREAWQNWVATR